MMSSDRDIALEKEDDEDGGGEKSESKSSRLRKDQNWTSVRYVSKGGLSEREITERMAAFRDEDVSRKTVSRRLVEKFLRHQRWYYPKKYASETNKISVRDAWCYYEHMTLPRYIESETQVAGQAPDRAAAGENEQDTELYSVWGTPVHWLKEWGIGVRMYFTTLRAVGAIFFISGLIQSANLAYYADDDYTGAGGQDAVMIFSRGSMICTNRTWVACTDCEVSSFDEDHYGVYTDPATGEAQAFVLRTLCKGAELSQGLVNWGTFIFMFLAFSLLFFYQQKIEVRFDEDQCTCSDYSIVVTNPPPDALDPDVWRDFFEQYSEKGVTVVTVALNNEQLVRMLANRRHFRNNLRYHLPPGTDIDNEETLPKAVQDAAQARKEAKKSCMGMLCNCTLVPILRPFGLFLTEEQLYEKVQALTPRIQELQKQKYTATRIFVTFETEAGQRNALAALSVSKINKWRNNTRALGSSSLFQGKILRVKQPTEPDAVRWLDLSVPTMKKYMQRIITAAITCGLIALSAFVINKARSNVGVVLSSALLSIFNMIIPNIVKLLLIMENHTAEGGRQASLYFKITLFRWVNTAILILIITPFTKYIGDGGKDVIVSVCGLLISEMLLSPALRILDIVSTTRKHYFAMRERTQEAMNSHFNGTHYNLAERYTDFTKVIFLCFFYSSMLPSIFFFGTLILATQYWSDKFCLLRVWGPRPLIGPQVARTSRRYFFSAALVAFAFASSYLYAQFPYDNVCDPNDPVDGFAGKYNGVEFANGTTSDITVKADNSVAYCDQRFDWHFPAIPMWQSPDREWMTESQEDMTRIYGWTSIAALTVFVVFVFGGYLTTLMVSLCKGAYKPEGKDQMIDFSGLKGMFAYIPQVKYGGYAYPFLACDIDDIDEELVGWNDPKALSYDEHNLIYDVPYEGMKRHARGDGGGGDDTTVEETMTTSSVKKDPIFSIVKHYPPGWLKKDA